MDSTDDEALERIPALRGRRRTVVELPGGLTNRNLRVTTDDGGDHVVRLFRADPERLGIDREGEHANSGAAAEAGVGAPVVDYVPGLALVVEFVEGTTLDNESFDDAAVLERAGRAVRRLHDGPVFTGDFDMFRRQAGYHRRLRDEGVTFFDGYDEHADAFERARQALASAGPASRPCNNDLLAANFIDGPERMWLIDYEYSGNNDPAFELGNTATECDLDGDRTEAFVTAYAGHPDPALLSRVRLQMLVSAYGWALWGLTQAHVSELDFDFWSWGQERFEKAARGFTSSSYDALLDEVGRGRQPGPD